MFKSFVKFVVVFLLLFHSTQIIKADTPLPGFGSGRAGTLSPQASAYEYTNLKQRVTLWSDGRGDVILDYTVKNHSLSNWGSLTWYFSWPSGSYSKIRAWDKDGPLSVNTQMSGTTIYVTTNFRRNVPIDVSYSYSLAITIEGMAQGSYLNWRANWYTRPGADTKSFTQGVAFPTSSNISSISPLPTSRVNTYLEWSNGAVTADWQLTIDVSYALSTSIGAPLFKQTDLPWAPLLYAFNTVASETIAKWGCFTTSAAMLVEYWAETQQLTFRTNPEMVDNWLKSQKVGVGYDSDNGVVHSGIALYARSHGVMLYWNETISYQNNGALDDYLLTGNPVILGVCMAGSPAGKCPNHFVLATGKTQVDGVDTYTINDPIYGVTTLKEKYAQKYNSIVAYSPSTADIRSLRISAHSPVEFVVIDPLGRKAGLDPTSGQLWNEIPGATYLLENIVANGNRSEGNYRSSKFLEVSVPLDGAYQIQVIGTGTGSYKLNISTGDWRGVTTSEVYTGQAVPGSVDNYDFGYSSVIHQVFLPSVRK